MRTELAYDNYVRKNGNQTRLNVTRQPFMHPYWCYCDECRKRAQELLMRMGICISNETISGDEPGETKQQ